MGKYRVKRENGKVIIQDEYTMSLILDDNSELIEKIRSNPHLNYWERMDVISLIKGNK